MTKEQLYNSDVWTKLKVYIHYRIGIIELNNSFHVVDKHKKDWMHGWGKPDKETKGIAYYFYKGFNTMSFEDFFLPCKNNPKHDPAWEHYWRFEQEIII